MQEKKRLSNIMLMVLGVVFIICLALIVVVNSRTQTKIFWDNQQDKLALITEKCMLEINEWARLQSAILKNISYVLLNEKLQSREDYEHFLAEVVKQNPEIQSAYLTLDNGEAYFNSDYVFAESDAQEYFVWHQKSKEAGGEIIFTEPYLDPLTKDLVVSCLRAITMPGGMMGVVGTDISLRELNERVGELHPSQTGGAYLASPQGKVMTYIDPALLPRVENGKAVFITTEEVLAKVTNISVSDKYLEKGIEVYFINDYDGIIKYEAITSVPMTGWILGVNIPLADYDEAVRAVINNQIPVIALALLMCGISLVFALMMVSNTKKHESLRKSVEIAEAASKTKSDFLSRMSHEIRTPMNAIIGMTKIAESTGDVGKLKYCLSTIEASSTHLLGVINDVLDMSKIEAGKLELVELPLNVEKMLMRLCNLIVDKTDLKAQKLDIALGRDMGMHYLGDELRLSQVLANLLSNAVKFTPEGGRISLVVEEAERDEKYSTLRFAVTDTGIGITPEQLSRLFNSFEQADGSISRRFGGTGLGLAISKSIVEKMEGRIWARSTPGQGSTFSFEVKLKHDSQQDKGVVFDGVSPKDIRLLVVDDEQAVREYFLHVTERFGFRVEQAASGMEAVAMTDRSIQENRPYDIIFLDCDMPQMNGVETLRRLNRLIDKNTVIIMTTFLNWNRIETEVTDIGVNRFISKPLFPSAILDAINEVVGNTMKALSVHTVNSEEKADFSGYHLLFVEDVEINREIFMALMEDTHIAIDCAENGLAALDKFNAAPDKYDLIIMDVQMPEMDGYEATRRIRALGTEKAKNIPIVAMTANVFKEDIDKCLNSGMNDHLPKPINAKDMVEKMEFYLRKGKD